MNKRGYRGPLRLEESWWNWTYGWNIKSWNSRGISKSGTGRKGRRTGRQYQEESAVASAMPRNLNPTKLTFSSACALSSSD